MQTVIIRQKTALLINPNKYTTKPIQITPLHQIKIDTFSSIRFELFVMIKCVVFCLVISTPNFKSNYTV